MAAAASEGSSGRSEGDLTGTTRKQGKGWLHLNNQTVVADEASWEAGGGLKECRSLALLVKVTGRRVLLGSREGLVTSNIAADEACTGVCMGVGTSLVLPLRAGARTFTMPLWGASHGAPSLRRNVADETKERCQTVPRERAAAARRSALVFWASFQVKTDDNNDHNHDARQ